MSVSAGKVKHMKALSNDAGVIAAAAMDQRGSLQKAIAAEQSDEIRRVAEQIAKKGQVLGPRGAKKTMLAQQVLSELEGGGRVTGVRPGSQGPGGDHRINRGATIPAGRLAARSALIGVDQP